MKLNVKIPVASNYSPMVELLAPGPRLSSAIRDFASRAILPKGIMRKAAAVFFKTEEFERRFSSLKEEKEER